MTRHRTRPLLLALAMMALLLAVGTGVASASGMFQDKYDFNSPSVTCSSPYWERGRVDVYNPNSSAYTVHLHWTDSGGITTSGSFSVPAGGTVRRGLATAYNLTQVVLDAEGALVPPLALDIQFVDNTCVIP